MSPLRLSLLQEYKPEKLSHFSDEEAQGVYHSMDSLIAELVEWPTDEAYFNSSGSYGTEIIGYRYPDGDTAITLISPFGYITLPKGASL